MISKEEFMSLMENCYFSKEEQELDSKLFFEFLAFFFENGDMPTEIYADFSEKEYWTIENIKILLDANIFVEWPLISEYIFDNQGLPKEFALEFKENVREYLDGNTIEEYFDLENLTKEELLKLLPYLDCNVDEVTDLLKKFLV